MSQIASSPAGRAQSDRIRQSFERKLKVLERLAEAKRARVPLKAWYPTTLREFRSWELSGEFESWVSQSIDAPNGRYPELAGRLAELLKILKSDPVADENNKLNAELESMKLQNVRMEIAIRKLMDQIVLLGHTPEREAVVDIYK